MKKWKKTIKKDKEFYSKLKQNFPSKKYRWFLFDYFIVFDITINNKFLKIIKDEYNNLFLNKDKETWKKAFVNLSSQLAKEEKIKWDELGIFAFYVYNYSIFYFKKYNSIYTEENFIEVDFCKRNHFYNFLDSFYLSNLKNKSSSFNEKVMKILYLSK